MRTLRDNNKLKEAIPSIDPCIKEKNTSWFFLKSPFIGNCFPPNGYTKMKQVNLSKNIKAKCKDEKYVLDLCDEILDAISSRQHRFDFLRGDAGTMLPVDGFYEKYNLVVEYFERQHSESVPFFDKRETVSGVSRGEQRKSYDDRRKTVLKAHNIELVIISFSDFYFDSQRRIIPNINNDKMIVKKHLQKHIP